MPPPWSTSLLSAPMLPTASPISFEPVCKVSVLVAPTPPVNSTAFVPPEIVPEFVILPEPVMPVVPPLIVAPVSFVTSSIRPKMPAETPLISPP